LKVSNNEREETIANTPMDYTTLFKKCWSSRPDLRPSLNDILPELERLSKKNPVEFIANVIDSDGEVTQLISKASSSSRNPILSKNANTLIDSGNLILSNDNGRQSMSLKNISALSQHADSSEELLERNINDGQKNYIGLNKPKSTK
ncbi:31695_t:CDS:1, partial [Racocetra persica]